MEKSIIEKAKEWLEPLYDRQTRDEVRRLMEEDPALLEDSFYKNLEFGTGGLRGIMGVGTNRMNRYTVGMVTQVGRICEENVPGTSQGGDRLRLQKPVP